MKPLVITTVNSKTQAIRNEKETEVTQLLVISGDL